MKVFWKLLFFTVCGAWPACATELTVFAGSASLPPLEEAAKLYKDQTGINVILHFGGSGIMLNQIRLTGAGDIYIPGSPDFMIKARHLNLVEPLEIIIAYLFPAIVVPEGNPAGIRGLRDLSRPGLRIGIADPEGVCVGLYAVELLIYNHLLEAVSPNLVGMVESCAKTASLVSMGQVDAVLGWREFRGWNSALSEIFLPAPEEVPRIAYIPAAIVASSRQKPAARAFIDFLSGPYGRSIFERWGYITSEKEIRFLAPNARIGGEFQLPEGW